jgi:hypothetical protein
MWYQKFLNDLNCATETAINKTQLVDEILIVGSGGGATTAIMKHLNSRGLRTNNYYDEDGKKHTKYGGGPCPARGLYIYADPRVSIPSLYRRKFYKEQAKKLGLQSVAKLPATAEEYLSGNHDKVFGMLEHLQGWIACDSVLPITVEDFANRPDMVAAHLGVDVDIVSGFKLRPRQSSLKSQPSAFFGRLWSTMDATAKRHPAREIAWTSYF